MLREAIELLEEFGFIDGNTLPDSTPGDQYHFRSCKPNIIVTHFRDTTSIKDILIKNGYKIKKKDFVLTISK